METNRAPKTWKEIETAMAATLSAECGVTVEVCLRDGKHVTVFGAAAAVDKVVAYVTSACGWKFEDREDDEECGSFAYLVTA